MTDPKRKLQFAVKHPYDKRKDDSDEVYEEIQKPHPEDWCTWAARGVVVDLRDRAVIKWGFDDVDYKTRVEIITTLADIIRTAYNHKEKA